jgi:hypothetical protein
MKQVGKRERERERRGGREGETKIDTPVTSQHSALSSVMIGLAGDHIPLRLTGSTQIN